MKLNSVSIDPEVMHGTPVFQGTRVPVETLFDFLETDSTVDDFLYEFPSVDKEVVMDFLNSIKKEFVFHKGNSAG